MRSDPESFVEEKDLAFSDVLSLQKLDLDVSKGEHRNKQDVPFRAKFLLKTRKRDYTFFAKDGTERQIWIEGVHKLLQLNS